MKVMARIPLETTRLIREATSVIVNNRKIRCCVSAASPIQDFDFLNKNRQNRRFATMRILREFEVFDGTSCMFENQLTGL